MLVVKYNAAGVKRWTRLLLGDNGVERGNDIRIDDVSGAVLCLCPVTHNPRHFTA